MTSPDLINENLKLLAACQLFAAIGEAAQRELARRAYRRRFCAGEQIFSIGAPGQSMMAVCSGTVRINFPSTTGKEIILTDLAPGEIFGEISLLDGNERSANAVSLTASELLILERRDILPLLEQNPKIGIKLLQVLCGRLRRANELMADIAFYDLPTRLAKQVLRLAASQPNERGAGGQNSEPYRLSCSQVELANMIGASRENVNRCLKDWQRRGIVNLEEGRISLTMPAMLEKLAES